MPHDIIYVSAKSRCLARVKVEQELCRRNLYSQPVLDTQLSCEEFDEALDCESAEPTTCSDYYRPAVCAFNIAELSKEENAIFDRNDCLARETLKHKLCLRGFDKSFVESAHLVCE